MSRVGIPASPAGTGGALDDAPQHITAAETGGPSPIMSGAPEPSTAGPDPASPRAPVPNGRSDRIDAISVRRIGPDEVAAVFPLMRQLHQHLTTELFAGRMNELAGSGFELFAAHDGQRIVGLAGGRVLVTLSRGAHYYLDDLVVDERVRGQGIGRLLVAHVEAQARARGLGIVRLHSRPDVLGFYVREGYAPGASSYILKHLD